MDKPPTSVYYSNHSLLRSWRSRGISTGRRHPRESATTLQGSTEFIGAEKLREQCWQLFRENLIPPVPYSFIGKILGINKGIVKYHYKSYAILGAEPGDVGHPPLVSDEHCEPLIKAIEEGYR
jgi:hypothetical protein